ncbi:hypothetical protein P885DRAFT_72198 [Corynascus similis CBS 632.67]
MYAIDVVNFYLFVRLLNRTDIPKIKNLPKVPGFPIFGNLIELGTDHAHGKYFWIMHQSSLISRPTFHTFHKVVSSSQGFTIGTSPWDESCKRRRRAAGTALNRPAVQSYMPILDLESTASIKELLADSRNGTKDIDPTPYFARFALNTSLTLNYGFRISGDVNSELLREITVVEREISNFRSTSNN